MTKYDFSSSTKGFPKIDKIGHTLRTSVGEPHPEKTSSKSTEQKVLVGEENPLTRQPGAVACLRAGLLRRSLFASGSSASPPPIYDFDLPRALKLSVMH